MPRKYFYVVEGARRPRLQSAVKRLDLPPGADVVDFRAAVFKSPECALPAWINDASTLKVFANSTAATTLGMDEILDDCGVAADNPLVVELPLVWFQLTDATTGDPLEGTSVGSVPLTEWDTIMNLKDAVRNRYSDTDLMVYDSSKRGPLGVDSQIEILLAKLWRKPSS